MGRTRSETNAAAPLRQTTLRQFPDSHKRKRPSAEPPRVGVPQHQDVIELSSDDELPLPRKAPVSKRRSAAAVAVAVAPASEAQPVLEITDSSDNDASSKPAASNSDGTAAVAFLKNKNKKLEEVVIIFHTHNLDAKCGCSYGYISIGKQSYEEAALQHEEGS
jgi:hypothetical protein